MTSSVLTQPRETLNSSCRRYYNQNKTHIYVYPTNQGSYRLHSEVHVAAQCSIAVNTQSKVHIACTAKLTRPAQQSPRDQFNPTKWDMNYIKVKVVRFKSIFSQDYATAPVKNGPIHQEQLNTKVNFVKGP